MTRKHFNAIAKILQGNKDKEDIIKCLCILFQEDNPYFNNEIEDLDFKLALSYMALAGISLIGFIWNIYYLPFVFAILAYFHIFKAIWSVI